MYSCIPDCKRKFPRMGNCMAAKATAFDTDSLDYGMQMAEGVAAVESEIVSEHNSEEGLIKKIHE